MIGEGTLLLCLRHDCPEGVAETGQGPASKKNKATLEENLHGEPDLPGEQSEDKTPTPLMVHPDTLLRHSSLYFYVVLICQRHSIFVGLVSKL
jgi:hypothetical protein